MFSGPILDDQITLPWVCTTAFGRDVVPDVNMIPTGNIGSATRVGSDEPSAKRSANGMIGGPLIPETSVTSDVSPLLSTVTARNFSCGALSATICAYCGWVMPATHWVCAAKYSISGPALRVFVVTPTAPSIAHANQLSTCSGELSACSRTLSFLPIPRAAKPAARLLTSSRNFEYVHVSALPSRGSQIRKGCSGLLVAQWRSSHGTSCPRI
jgi:hypothetical protein